MKRAKPIPKRRKRPRVVHGEYTAHLNGGHARVRLYGKERAKRREEIFERAGGRCEETYALHFSGFEDISLVPYVRCNAMATEWSHLRHGANKCDCLDPRCNWASCSDCHTKRHNCGGRPLVRNGGRA